MAKTATKVRKKVKKNVAEGIAHVHASFNNTIITITDRQGNALSWATSGGAGFKGSRKSTPFAAQIAAEAAGKAASGMWCEESRSSHQGPRPRTRIRCTCTQCARHEDNSITDITPIPAQRMPAAQAPPHLRQIRHHGPKSRRKMPPVPPRGRKALPQRRKVLH
jgi:small subunit ribosomal protein S11